MDDKQLDQLILKYLLKIRNELDIKDQKILMKDFAKVVLALNMRAKNENRS